MSAPRRKPTRGARRQKRGDRRRGQAAKRAKPTRRARRQKRGPGPGRPPADPAVKRSHLIPVRVTSADHARIVAAAKAAQQTLSDWGAEAFERRLREQEADDPDGLLASVAEGLITEDEADALRRGSVSIELDADPKARN